MYVCLSFIYINILIFLYMFIILYILLLLLFIYIHLYLYIFIYNKTRPLPHRVVLDREKSRPCQGANDETPVCFRYFVEPLQSMTTHVFALMLFGDDSPRARCQEPWSLEIVIVAWILPCKTSRRIGSLVVKTQLQQHVMPPLARPSLATWTRSLANKRASVVWEANGQAVLLRTQFWPVSLDV